MVESTIENLEAMLLQAMAIADELGESLIGALLCTALDQVAKSTNLKC